MAPFCGKILACLHPRRQYLLTFYLIPGTTQNLIYKLTHKTLIIKEAVGVFAS